MSKVQNIKYNKFIGLILIIIILTMAMLSFVVIRDKINNNDITLMSNLSKNNIISQNLNKNSCGTDTQQSSICHIDDSTYTENTTTEAGLSDTELLITSLNLKNTNNLCFNLHVKSSYKIGALDIKEAANVIDNIEIKSDFFSINKFTDKIALLRKIDDKTLEKEANTDLDIGILCVNNSYKDKILSILDDKNFVFFEYGTGEALNTMVVFSN